MKDTLFQPAERPETLGSTVLTQIKDLLLSGRLMPGEQLSLRSTASALGVSVMPVREAVNQLVADHALEVTPNRAVRVPVLTQEQFSEITQIRIEIEGYAVAQACAHIDSETLARLEGLNNQLAAAMESDSNTDDIVGFNKDLHFMVYQTSRMPMLVSIIETLWLRIGPILNYDLRNGSERTRNKTAVGHHAQLIEGLKTGNIKLAKQGLRNDIQSAYEHIIAKHYMS